MTERAWRLKIFVDYWHGNYGCGPNAFPSTFVRYDDNHSTTYDDSHRVGQLFDGVPYSTDGSLEYIGTPHDVQGMTYIFWADDHPSLISDPGTLRNFFMRLQFPAFSVTYGDPPISYAQARFLTPSMVTAGQDPVLLAPYAGATLRDGGFDIQGLWPRDYYFRFEVPALPAVPAPPPPPPPGPPRRPLHLILGISAVPDVVADPPPPLVLPLAPVLTAEATSATSAQLHFADVDLAITYEYRLNGSSTPAPMPVDRVISGLAASSIYLVEVRAWSLDGPGPWSNQVSVTTWDPVVVPTPPVVEVPPEPAPVPPPPPPPSPTPPPPPPAPHMESITHSYVHGAYTDWGDNLGWLTMSSQLSQFTIDYNFGGENYIRVIRAGPPTGDAYGPLTTSTEGTVLLYQRLTGTGHLTFTNDPALGNVYYIQVLRKSGTWTYTLHYPVD